MAVCTYPHRSRASPATLIHFSLIVLAVSLFPLPLAGQYLVVSPSDPESASDVELVRNLRVQLQGLGMEVVGGGDQLAPTEYCVEFVASTIPVSAGRFDAAISTSFVRRTAEGHVSRTKPEIPYHFHATALDKVAETIAQNLVATVAAVGNGR